ncbi:MAG: DNA methyltransferase [Chloroflexaceae bacterium]|nr:DNA methyltransferase [Chloroflexaceae bacterium]
METQDPIPLFDELVQPAASPVPDLLYLPRAALLDELVQALAETTQAAVSAQIERIRAALDQATTPPPAAANSPAMIAMLRTHLHEALDQIVAAHTTERAHYYIERLVKSISEERTSAINDINLNRWKEYDDILTDSLWVIDRRDSSGAHMADYWGNFIPQIPHQMMRRYTKLGDWVLDPFAGSGTTLIEGQRLGRNTLGIELQASVAAAARQRIASEPNPYGTQAEIVVGDSTRTDYPALLRAYGRETVQLVLMHPPYFDIIKFSEDPHDLSNAASLDAFLERMSQLAAQVQPVLERGRYLALVIGDKYVKGEWVPLGFQTMQAVQQQGFMLKSIVVKNFEETTGKRTQQQLWRYRALMGGFYIFKHEYIFVFQNV